jgi:hypothetical protein
MGIASRYIKWVSIIMRAAVYRILYTIGEYIEFLGTCSMSAGASMASKSQFLGG